MRQLLAAEAALTTTAAEPRGIRRLNQDAALAPLRELLAVPYIDATSAPACAVSARH